jgi:hypothetical protein
MKHRYDLTYDVRVIERSLQEGAIAKKDYEEYLKKLSDVSDKGCPLVIDEEPEENQAQLNANDEVDQK